MPAGQRPMVDEVLTGAESTCPHPAWRVFAWIAADGALCAGCCDCGEVLAGEAGALTDTSTEEV